MYIYNVTIKVEWSIQDAWLTWMREEQMPGMLATDLFYKYQMVRLLEVDEEEGPTYAIQYYTTTKEAYERYLATASSRFMETALRKWGQKFIFFGTLMEVIN